MIPIVIAAVALAVGSALLAAAITIRDNRRPDRIWTSCVVDDTVVACRGTGPLEVMERFTVSVNGQLVEVVVTDTMSRPDQPSEWGAVSWDHYQHHHRIRE